MRLLVVVEGQTEEAFVKEVLAPHLLAHEVYAAATIVGTPKKRGSAALIKGGGNWDRWARDIHRALSDQPGNDFRVTTLFDLYGLPIGFPGLDRFGALPDTNRRCDELQARMASSLGDWRLIPYIQRHEFEALVLASISSLGEYLDSEDDLDGLAALQQDINGMAAEDINDGRTNAPSKRILRRIPGYRKTLHGPLATISFGLNGLREQCPRLCAWVNTLETLEHGTEQ